MGRKGIPQFAKVKEKNYNKIFYFIQTSPCQNKMSIANQIEEAGLT